MRRAETILIPTLSRPSTGPESPGGLQALRWFSLALLVGIACCSQGTGSSDLQAESRTDQVHVFLIDPEEGGVLGKPAGCGDGAVPVEVKLPRESPALEGSLEALLGLGSDRYHPGSGYYNALHASPLQIEKNERQGAEVRVRLGGYLELGESCDGERALSQLSETALQFSDVEKVYFYLGDQPLREALAGR